MSAYRSVGLDSCKECGVRRFYQHKDGCSVPKQAMQADLDRGCGLTAGDPICPHCFYYDEHWSESFRDRDDGVKRKVTCPSCDKNYETTMCIEVSFCSKPLKAGPPP